MQNGPPSYQLLADAVLALHVGIVVFVVGGLVLISVHRRPELERSPY